MNASEPTKEDHGSIEDVTLLPIWTPWIIVDTPSKDCFQMGRAIKLGASMTKRQAWEVARNAMDNRQEVIGMAVRREGKSLCAVLVEHQNTSESYKLAEQMGGLNRGGKGPR